MKTNVNIPNKNLNRGSLPCVKVYASDLKRDIKPLVVLFYAKCHGVILSSDGDTRTGNLETNLVEYTSYEWADFHGTIEFP